MSQRNEILEAIHDAQFADKHLARFERARSSLLDFTCYTYPKFMPSWHHARVCQLLDRFAAGSVKKAMIFMPPRMGKTELAGRRFPAYMLGLNPDEQFIYCSYSADLAGKTSREVQRIISDPFYSILFPGTRLKSMVQDTKLKVAETSDMFEIVGKFGYFRSAGIGGGITGLGFSKGIIDDPYKDHQQAYSETYREKVWDWYTSTFMTRMETNAGQLIFMTRWHEDDLAGRLLEQQPGEWEILTYPALKEGPPTESDPRLDGEALWPEKKNREELLEIKKISLRDWDSLYRQDPRTEGGNLVKRDWWRFYSVLPDKFDQQMISVDAAFKDNPDSDYVVIQVWGRIGVNKFLLDQIRAQMGIIKTIDSIKIMRERWPRARKVLIEDKANGTAIIEMLKSKMSGIVAFEPEGSKESRVIAVSPQIEGGNIYIPDKKLAPWIEGSGKGDGYLDEFSKFPRGKNDDQVDATTQALIHLSAGEGRGLRALSQM